LLTLQVVLRNSVINTAQLVQKQALLADNFIFFVKLSLIKQLRLLFYS
jgi:hypothetical protein